MHFQTLFAPTNRRCSFTAAITLTLMTIGTAQGLIRSHALGLPFPSTSPQGAGFEVSASFAGDFNADGHVDYIVGNPLSGAQQSGIARAFSGKDGSPLLFVTGSPATHFGFSVAAAGDVDADGYDDVIVGAPDGGTGNAYLYSGRTLGNPISLNPASFGFNSGDRFGFSVSGAGDVDGDGFDDVIVGAPNHANNSGAFVVISGRTQSMIGSRVVGNPNARLGSSVSGVGDIDNTFQTDAVIVGAPGDNLHGTAQVFGIRAGTFQQLAVFTAPGTPPTGASIQFGFSVAGAGDVNDDGILDIIVGAPQDGPAGARNGSATVFSGDLSGTVLSATTGVLGSEFGYSVAGIGDFNGDHFDDFVVGAPGAGFGTAFIFAGSPGGGSLFTPISGPAGNGSRFGSVVAGSVARLGGAAGSDTDADGLDDVLFSARDSANAPPGAWGDVYLFNLVPSASPDHESFDGAPCGTTTKIPRIRYRGHVRNQSSIDIGLRGVAPNAMATLFIGLPSNLDLGPIGAPGCTLLVDATIIVPAQPAVGGLANVTIPWGNNCIPNAPFDFQWAILSPGANPLGVITSNALRCRCK